MLSSFLAFEKDATAAITKSKVDLFYLPPDEIATAPKHPYDPNKDIHFTDGNKATEIKGPLSLDFVPNIQFHAQKGSWEEERYYAPLIQVQRSDEKGLEQVPNFVQVTDDRGSLSGWTLVLRQNGQFRNGAHELEGTEIKLSKLHMVSGESKRPPIAFQEITLDPDGKESSLVIQAKKGTGAGTWLGLFGKDNQEAQTAISVTVPGEVTKEQGKYQTSLTWELHDSPI
ncbi:WxL domain-containing protein [Listeria kieliensis]|uniref:WxL domain-containing protein n=1 Tax=Listeria kieliensis TaxID=1621700 RepID=UPI001F0B8282|nr:WxL domain-containing protein [Listeria kieliensis]